MRKGILRHGLAAACLVGGLTLVGGCGHYRNLVDPCYPQRYEHMARTTVRETFGAQAHNGHVLEQTVWNYHFEPGTDKLTPGGLEHLAYLGRRRPCPDPVVYLQTAQDLAYDPAATEKFVEARNTLDLQRIEAVKKYVHAQTANRRIDLQVVVHDPGEVGQSAVPMGNSIRAMHAASAGVLGTSGGTVAGGAGVGGSGR
jgi:hypothetical protein